ncbi:DUF1697 domain-containing protein [Mariprofundus sp. EBB-1]|uniref:DUF1697 domain-containing protein n=1 Tax=Mariprofundus sp. EBB-1 TaxID=2650971 RepID=UPI000EF1C524|nr:DUF1697 domain-containing protein [Mariprofundus sp. EBB-1]RLL51168.1 DUF1697 domain-containing protein [Mariprofundus sp. EBB-1]
MKYISILRGINVSGQKKVLMADLKKLYHSLGFEDVTTYIQSGNVIFQSSGIDKNDIKDTIEQAITAKYGFHVPVIIRTEQELIEVFDNCPYEEAKIETNGTKIFVTFLQSEPSRENQETLQQYVKAPEKLTIHGSEVYLYCPNGYGKSKLSNTFLENKLAVSATTRNWKSIIKLCELSGR